MQLSVFRLQLHRSEVFTLPSSSHAEEILTGRHCPEEAGRLVGYRGSYDGDSDDVQQACRHCLLSDKHVALAGY